MKRELKKGVLLGILLIGISSAYSQQEYHYSQYMFSQMDMNPGSAGSSGMICLTGHFRKQWVNFEGAPQTTSFTVDAPIKIFGISSGIGLSAISDKFGYVGDQGMKLSYAYRADAGSGKIGIGISGGFLQKKIENGDFRGYNKTEGQVEPINNIPSDGNKFGADMSIGVFYKTDDVYLGISTTHLNSKNYQYDEDTKIDFQQSPHIFITGGFKKQLENPLFEISPSLMFYSDLVEKQVIGTPQFIGGATLTYNKKVWGGVSYRVGSAFIGMIGFELGNNLQFGLSYDFETSKIGNYYRNSFEGMLRYCFSLDVDKMPKKYKSIRYL